MSLGDAALIAAGLIGSGVAVVHGILVERLMVSPLKQLRRNGEVPSAPARRLIPALLQFSTFNWFVTGLALIAATLWLGDEARLIAGLLAASSYLYGAIANWWETRGRHPGWMFYALAIGLIALGLAPLTR
jgi:hypothetical protein